MTLEELIRLVIAASVIIAFAFILFRIMAPKENQTQSSFKTLAAEIKLLAEELEDKDKAEITVPLFIGKEYVIGTQNQETTKCKGKPCILLQQKATLDIIDVKIIEDVVFNQDEFLETPEGAITKVKITAQKEGENKTITIEQISN